ncbi:MAG: DUF4956 domain-containing protein [Actinomycetales bacterium]
MSLALIGANFVAVIVLVAALFVPRHGRRDLVVAYLGVNVGVLAVSTALSTATVTAGLGLGLFGVLSIIRLRSDELAQREIAYYFAALALGLLGGLGAANEPLVIALMALIVVVMWIGDHPRLAPTGRRQELVLDRAYVDEAALLGHLESLLGTVLDVQVLKVDLANDLTHVAVRVPHPKKSAHSARRKPAQLIPGPAAATMAAASVPADRRAPAGEATR